MLVTFAWWLAFAVACATLVLGASTIATYDKHKNVPGCAYAIIAMCLAVGVLGVTAGHAYTATHSPYTVCITTTTSQPDGC